jgi:beta-galactosidase
MRLNQLILVAAAALCAPAHSAERVSFNADWRFAKGDHGAAEPGFSDTAWRKLDLPHDWGIEGPFRQEYPGETGKLPWWGVAWYRKSFDVPASDAGKRVYLDIDGAMSNASVWLNGHNLGKECAGDPARQSDGIVALVSRRRHLPQHLAGEGLGPACGA